ncbi:MAG: hypothetical protein J6Y01_06620 [Spirochaetales bacterium]|nr:hypothetical protein [Spirochaetales bacterium]
MDNKFLIKPSEKEVKEKTAQILSQSSDIESAPADKWAKDMFTKSDVLRKWDFSEMVDGTDGGDYVIRFTYSEGSDILRLTDSLFIADGNPIGYFPQMMSVGSNDREAAFNITVPKGTKQLEMFALARAGKSDNSGTISVLMKEDDETIEDDEDDAAAQTEDLSLLNDDDDVELPTDDDDESDEDDEEEE